MVYGYVSRLYIPMIQSRMTMTGVVFLLMQLFNGMRLTPVPFTGAFNRARLMFFAEAFVTVYGNILCETWATVYSVILCGNACNHVGCYSL